MAEITNMIEVQGFFLVTNSTTNFGVKQDGAFNGSSVVVGKSRWRTGVIFHHSLCSPRFFHVELRTPLMKTQQQNTATRQ
jgi:hypothetical protein